MMTNIIAYLHTTMAYQSAAMQLMVAQANFDAQQLHLRETLPIVVPADANQWNVAMPPYGVTGSLVTSNYVYRFIAGKLISIQINGRPHSAADFQPSLIDTNGAYQLARQWLVALSVDVPALESNCPPSVRSARSPSANINRQRSQSPILNNNRVGGPNEEAMARRAREIATNNVPRAAVIHATLPVFGVSWGGVRTARSTTNPAPMQVSMEILGSTRQCLSLRIYNPNLLTAPPLQVTNAAALLGPPPPPQQFVEEFLGGKAAYDTVAQPEQVQIWLTGSQPDNPETRTNRTQPMVLNPTTAAVFSRAFSDFNSYSWLGDKACPPDYGVRLRFTRGAEVVEFAWCYGCDHLQVTYQGRSADKDCDAARSALVRAVQSVFPKDDIIKNLSLPNPNQSN